MRGVAGGRRKPQDRDFSRMWNTGSHMILKTIYHAGASSEIDLIEKQNAVLVEEGWKITFDWTIPVRKAGSGSPDDKDIRRSAALADLEGVVMADVVWISQPEGSSTSTGVWVELGYALA